MIYDIRKLGSVKFTSADMFFLDTNVILFLHHPPTTNYNRDKAELYSNFIAMLRKTKCSLCISSFNIQEAFHVVETVDLKAYRDAKNVEISRKAYRKKYRTETGVAQSSLWGQLKENYTIEDAIVNKNMLESFIKKYNEQYYDPIDYLFTENHPECCVVTDDPDFQSDDSLSVFTIA